MKKVIFLILLPICLFITSCGDKINKNDSEIRLNNLRTMFPKSNLYLKSYNEFYLVWQNKLFLVHFVDNETLTVKEF